jgi:hypothetical protein
MSARIGWPAVIRQAAEIAGSYDTSVTLRQLFYRLVSVQVIPNTQGAYKWLTVGSLGLSPPAGARSCPTLRHGSDNLPHGVVDPPSLREVETIMSSVIGTDGGAGWGVKGTSASGSGVVGDGPAWAGVVASSVTGSGVSAFSDSGAGVLSVSNGGPGVSGESTSGAGVLGKSLHGAGVSGEGNEWAGVAASSTSGSGVSAFSDSGAGVLTVTNSGPAVSAQSGTGPGVDAKSDRAVGVHGHSGDAVGVVGESLADHGVSGSTPSATSAGVAGNNTSLAGGTGVAGTASGSDGTGVSGTSAGAGGTGVRGHSDDGIGVAGDSLTGNGVEGTTGDGVGVYGWVVEHGSDDRADGDPNHERDRRGQGTGVLGVAGRGNGVKGQSSDGTGVWAESGTGEGVHGQTQSRSASAVVGLQLDEKSVGAAIYGEHRGQDGIAGFFRGNVVVTGHIEFAGADCAEEFTVAGNEPTGPGGGETVAMEPGTVMVIGDDEALCPSTAPYDRRVAGVVAGAGGVYPGLVLGADVEAALRHGGGLPVRGGQGRPRARVALAGRVWCKVDADQAPIAVGALLTTAPTAGHAMAVADHERATGAVLGKALRRLHSGTGIIPILVTLQ